MVWKKTRRFFYLYEAPKMKEVPPPGTIEKNDQGNRVFATLFYPNALAGALLLLLPPVLGFIGPAR